MGYSVNLCSPLIMLFHSVHRAVEAAHKIAESRKLLSGYQFVLTQDQELVGKMVKHSMVIQQPIVIVWEPGTGLFYPYSVSNQL